jgi:hypothetical protein
LPLARIQAAAPERIGPVHAGSKRRAGRLTSGAGDAITSDGPGVRLVFMSSDPPASSDFPAYADRPASADSPAVYSDWSSYGDWPGNGGRPPVKDLPGSTDAPVTGAGGAAGPDGLPGAGGAAGPDAPVTGAGGAAGPAGLPGSDEPPTAAEAPAGDRPPGRDWRFLILPRWLGWHALMIVLVIGMLALGDWQFRRAEAGNALSWAYTFEWPIFAGFVIVFWAKTIRDEFRPPTWPEWTYSNDVQLPGGALAARSGPGGEGDEDEDEELAEYNAYLARLTAEARGHGKWHGLR